MHKFNIIHNSNYFDLAQEVKTKPTQHSVYTLRRLGLIPDSIVLRAEKPVGVKPCEKLSIMCGVPKDYIFQVLTFRPVYKLFLDLERQGLCDKIQSYFGAATPRKTDLTQWINFIELIEQSTKRVKIGLVAKYVGSNDPYISVIEAINSAGYWNKVKVDLVVIEAEHLEKAKDDPTAEIWKDLAQVKGIVVPGGFDNRGVQGKMLAAKWAREHNVPYLGLCLGMQVMLIEFARNVLGLKDANSSEFDKETSAPVISLLEEQKGIERKGATMRLGTYPCKVLPGTKAYQAYGKELVEERHRHRYEFNNKYRQQFEQAGVVFSGVYPEKDLVEISEIKDHPFMLGTQAHPEFKSSPLNVAPLFMAFMKAVVEGI